MASDSLIDTPEGPAAPYRVLARKYRPRSFDDLIGQEPMVRTLTNAFESGRIAQAWMLTGVRGVGKTTTARILARALNYETATVHRPTIHMDEPGIHDQAIMEGRHVDVVEMDAASHTGIDDIREIIAQVRYRPVTARYKVYIIDEVHMLSTQAFNGLLKTLEEPPEHVKFVFATTEIRKVPITVLSRCQRFDLRRVEAGALVAHLGRVLSAESVEADPTALGLIARASEGSVRDALSIADQAIAHGAGQIGVDTVRDMLGLADRARIIDLFEQIMRGDARAALIELREQHASGADPATILVELADFTHLVTTLRYVPEAADDATLSPDEATRGRFFAETLSVRTLGQVWQMLLKAVEETRAAAAPRQAAEMALIRIAHAADLPSPDEVLRRLVEEGGDAVPGGSGGGSRPANGGGAAQAQAAMPQPAPRALAPSPRPEAPRAALSLAPQASGPNLAMMMRAPAPAPAVVPVVPTAPDLELPRSLDDIAALARDEARMRISIRRYLRLKSIEPGHIEAELAPGAPPTFANDLSRKLFDWTGRRYVVSLVSEGGGQTIEETIEARRLALIAEAERDPEIAAILAMMPGATIREVRLRGEPEIVEEPTAPIDSGDFGGSDALPERIDIDPSDLLPDFDATGGSFDAEAQADADTIVETDEDDEDR